MDHELPAVDEHEHQHLDGHGAVVSFEIAGGYDAACTFVESLQLCTLVEHVGSVETLITHPASMTHADVPPAQRESAGITDGLLRLSVGLEPTHELLNDIEHALALASQSPCPQTEEAVHA